MDSQQQLAALLRNKLAEGEKTPGCSILLLQIIDSTTVDPSVRFAAALYFKNFVKKEWIQHDDDQDKISYEDRSTIKTTIISLMDLVARLSLQNLDGNVGVLQTAHSIFKRWRHHFRSDALYSEIKFSINQFASPYFEFFKLVNRMMSFLASVAKACASPILFEQPGALERICGQIVLPNMALRVSDSRRSAAVELVAWSFGAFFGGMEITQIFSVYISKYLENYESDRVANWHAKDTALFLITALSARSVTAQIGVTQTNEHIPILPVFLAHVLPDLHAAIDGAMHPIIKVDAIKYLTIFAVLSRRYCYFAGRVLSHLFDRIEAGGTPEKLSENDYLMKCVMRVIATVP
ncbi:hypothetical protein BASA81_017925 [Batrachochytrium salamandrivorans]|nr:hypothetical protein BASA81_017925 [Batrachochytrium salamandrivorans]